LPTRLQPSQDTLPKSVRERGGRRSQSAKSMSG
jgi:hypothetical protein